MKRHPVFTPTAVPPGRLDELTVGRAELIARLVTRLRDIAATDARPHTLVVGFRGSGKTHLLSVALHRSLRDPDVASRLAVAWIPEDALSIGSYLDLLVELTRALDATADDDARVLRQRDDATGLERLLLTIANGRAVVLVLENLDRIFTSVGRTGQSALRGFVETAGSVVLFASTPLLFAGIASREEPWYGSFDVEHLADLDLAEGTELLHRAARDSGDAELAAFVGSPDGQARLRAVEQLAGGSPRLWHVLSECITVAALDELIPAVEALLDELAPYYQQRLWELPANEQKLVVELGRQSGAQTVGRLAAAVGMGERAAATSLGRLAEARWVKRAKLPGTDQRATWYELREPLLRHHLQFRDTRGEPLRFVVEFLKVWYSSEDRRRHLLAAAPGSPTEQHFLRTFLDSPPRRSDAAWADRDPERLLVEAKCWAAGSAQRDRLSGSRALGIAVQAVVDAARGASGAQPLPAGATPAQRSLVASAVAAVRGSGAEDVPDRVGDGLRALASDDWSGDDRDLLVVLSECWDGRRDPSVARDRIAEVAARRTDEQTPLALTARAEHAFWVGEAGDPAAARSLLESLRPELAESLGAEHDDSLTCRQSLAYWTGEAGDPAAARDLYATLVTDRERVSGPHHEDTLASRHGLAYWTGEAGDPAAARDLYATLVTDRERVLGPHHEDTLTSRHNHAYWTGEAGDPAAARDLYATLVTDRERVLGPHHEDTLTSRHNHAQWTGEAGDPAAARDLYATLVTDRERVLGPHHQNTLASRTNLAYWTGLAGDAAAARDQFAALVADHDRVAGPDHENTLASRHYLAYWTGLAGDAAAARDQFAALVLHAERILGPDHENTRVARHRVGHWTGVAGDPAGAAAILADVVAHCHDTLGAEHPETLGIRAELASWTGEAGDVRAAHEEFAEVARLHGRSGSGGAVALALGSWLTWGLRAGRSPAELASSVPARTFGGAVSSMFAVAGVPDGVLPELLDATDDDELASVVLQALLTPTPRPPGWRRAMFEHAAPRLDVELRTRLRTLTDALAGDAEALAAQPAEIRPLVEGLAARDRATNS